MAEKETEENEAQPEKKKKKGLPSVVLIALGAILGGAGIVFGMPSGQTEEVSQPKVQQPLKVHLKKNPMEITFNPRSSSGKAFGQVAFTFVYQLENRDDLDESLQMVKDYWDGAKSECMKLLRNRDYKEFRTEDGLTLLERDLRDELTYQLFPGTNEGRIARVIKIWWDEILVQ